MPYAVEVPSFGSPWAYVIAFDATDVPGSALTPEAAADAGARFAELSSAAVDARLAARLDPGQLRCYDGTAHRGVFGLPKYVRAALAAEARVITVDSPVFMY